MAWTILLWGAGLALGRVVIVYVRLPGPRWTLPASAGLMLVCLTTGSIVFFWAPTPESSLRKAENPGLIATQTFFSRLKNVESTGFRLTLEAPTCLVALREAPQFRYLLTNPSDVTLAYFVLPDSRQRPAGGGKGAQLWSLAPPLEALSLADCPPHFRPSVLGEPTAPGAGPDGYGKLEFESPQVERFLLPAKTAALHDCLWSDPHTVPILVVHWYDDAGPASKGTKIRMAAPAEPSEVTGTVEFSLREFTPWTLWAVPLLAAPLVAVVLVRISRYAVHLVFERQRNIEIEQQKAPPTQESSS